MKLNVNTTNRRVPRTLVQCAALVLLVAVAIGVWMLLKESMLQGVVLEGKSSKDAQQYVISANKVDPAPPESTVVARETRETTTKDLDEAVNALGFTPPLPSWYPAGWELSEYYAAQGLSGQWFHQALSSKTHENLLIYDLFKYVDLSEVNEGIEQDEVGRTIRCNGWDVYLTTNVLNHVAIWLDGNTRYAIFGPIPEEDMIRIIESIER